MTDQERLAEIKQLLRQHAVLPDLRRDQLMVGAAADWLVSEIERLKGRLKELEWAGATRMPTPVCVVCLAPLDVDPRAPEQHGPGCWLADEIREAP